MAAVLLPRAGGHARHAGDAVRAGLGAAGVGATAAVASTGDVSALERDVFHAINRLPDTAAPALWVVMQAGSFPAIFVAAGLALAARRPRLSVALAAGGTATWLLAKGVKQVVDRARPEALLHDVRIYGPAATGLGYPSGHAAVAAFVMTVAGPHLTRPTRVIGWVVVGLVAFTRVFVGAHLPLDAVGGLLLGWTTGSVTNLLFGTPDRANAGAGAAP
ncbi:MAG: phosphatase PAP2 family protein [Thermoleophilia bacterium]